jgi:hypothetical protein
MKVERGRQGMIVFAFLLRKINQEQRS